MIKMEIVKMQPKDYVFHVGQNPDNPSRDIIVTVAEKAYYLREGGMSEQHLDVPSGFFPPEITTVEYIESVFHAQQGKTVKEVKEAMINHGFQLDKSFWNHVKTEMF